MVQALAAMSPSLWPWRSANEDDAARTEAEIQLKPNSRTPRSLDVVLPFSATNAYSGLFASLHSPVAGPPPAPNQNRPFPAPLNLQFQPYPSQPHGSHPASGYGRIPSGSAPHPGFAGLFNLHANQQQYPYAPSVAQAPPPPSGAYPPPPPPKRQPQPSMYNPSSQ
ncbi:basic salivary proline-rich protein 3-like [Zingiber officinale]|uniref:basic salivary proline-rich protein 3-like n=1 Tax=Zingiber officinale TaxID=94328 RepID=UPI001C4C8C1C|nr:basic salivary proline-rich protein 3-like [Zingiber officinale]